MSLTSALAYQSPSEESFVFPGLFEHRETGSVWLASDPYTAIRIGLPHTPNGPSEVGDPLTSCTFGRKIEAGRHRQIHSPVTVTFLPAK